MPKALLSWIIAVLIILFIYVFFYFRRCRNHRRWIRRLFHRRRSSAAPFQFHLFDFQPMHLAGPDPAAPSIDHFAALKLLTNGRVSSDCTVCLAPFDDDETLRFIPECQHTFHPGCLDPWLEAHTTYPSCRASLVQPAHDSTGPQPVPESTRTYDVVIAVNSAEIEQEPSSGGGGFMLGTSPKVMWAHFWKHKSPLRLKILVYRVLSGAFPLARRRWCALCGADGETPEHLFFRHPVARALW